ncbi:MAG TPA: 50S ribosomal protein L4, partial [Ktedonobacterales bacterium]
TAQLTNRRQGNASTKTRAEVSGGNRKPYRQKGTGRARQGSTRAPQFRGGGVVFGPHPHAYERAIPRKMKRLAIRAALSDKAAEGHILLMDELVFKEARTKDMVALLEQLPLERNVLLLLPYRNQNAILSARNLHQIKMGNVASINVVELLKYDHLLMPVATLNKIVERFGEIADDALQMKRHPRVVLRKYSRRHQPLPDKLARMYRALEGTAAAVKPAGKLPQQAPATATATAATAKTAASAPAKATAATAEATPARKPRAARPAEAAAAAPAAPTAETPAAESAAPRRTRKPAATSKPQSTAEAETETKAESAPQAETPASQEE